MINSTYILIIILLLAFLFLLYNIIVWLIVRVPHVKSSQERLTLIFQNLKINYNSNIYELGCGTAEFLFQAEKYQSASLVGFELSPLLCGYTKLKTKFKKSKVKIKFQNFLKADLSQADIIYMFLVDQAVQQAWQKIKQETKLGTIVIILADQIKDVQPDKIIDINNSQTKIYFYKV